MSQRGRPARRRHQVLNHVRETIATCGRAPSYEQIAISLGFNTRQEVTRIVRSLEAAGALSRAGKGRVRRLSLGNGYSGDL